MWTKEALLNHSGMNEQLLLGSCVSLISMDPYDGTLVSGNKEYLGKKVNIYVSTQHESS